MITRNGKIARLPKEVREQLNQRLENGERGPSLLAWLNQLPEVQKIITDEFAGHPIRPQNLSQWRHGGYVEWTRHQLLREQTRWVSEQSAELSSDSGPRTITIAEDVATILSAELALHVQALGDITDPRKRFAQFRLLCREVSRLRRDDQRALRNSHRHEQWEYDHPARPSAGGASVPASRQDVCTPKPYIPTPEELNRLRLAAHYRQKAGIPQNPEATVPAGNPGNDAITPQDIPSVADLLRLRDAALHRPAANMQTTETPSPERQGAGALQDAPRIPEPPAPRASVPECGSPLPLSSITTRGAALPEASPVPPSPPDPRPSVPAAEQPPHNPPLPDLSTLNPLSRRSAAEADQLSTNSHSIPLNPTQNNFRDPKLETQNSKRPFNPHRDYYDPRPPIRGRRFHCLEG